MFARRTEWTLEPNALSRAMEARRARGLPILDLTESNPTRCGFVYDARTILPALSKPAALQYAPDPRGPLDARRAVAAYYEERGAPLGTERIFLTASTSEAYSYLFRLLANSGDCVLVPQPSYPLFDFLAGLNDLEVIPYTLAYDTGWSIDLDGLAATLDSGQSSHPARALIVVHPNNPTGSFVKQQERERLVEICHRHDLALVADEVFVDFALDGRERHTHADCDTVLSFTLSGLSKISALPQMKLAWIVVNGPAEVRARAAERLEVIADTYLSVSTPVASALPELLETRRALQSQIVSRLKGNLSELDRRLQQSGSRAIRLEVEGGWYTVLKLLSAPGMSDDEFVTGLAQDDGVLVHPGHFYNFPDEGYLVLSLLPAPADFAAGVEKLVTRLDHPARGR